MASSQRHPAPGRSAARARPDPSAQPLAIAFGGVATASALVAAFLAPTAAATATDPAVVVADPAPVQHVTRYVQLLPGQTAPPDATVVQAPAATPRVVVITTRQSGVKP